MKALGFWILLSGLFGLAFTHECHLIDDCQNCTQTSHCVFRIRDGIIRCAYKDDLIDVLHRGKEEAEYQSLALDVLNEAMCSWTLQAFFKAIGNDRQPEQHFEDVNQDLTESTFATTNITEDFNQTMEVTTTLEDEDMEPTNFSTPSVADIDEYPMRPCGNSFDILAFIAGCIIGILIFVIGNMCLKSSKRSEKRKTYNQPYTFDSFVNP